MPSNPERAQELRKRVARAQEAQSLMEHPVMRDAFAKLEKRYLTEWAQSELSDTVTREKLYLAINVLSDVRRAMAAEARDGIIAHTELMKIEDESQTQKAAEEDFFHG